MSLPPRLDVPAFKAFAPDHFSKQLFDQLKDVSDGLVSASTFIDFGRRATDLFVTHNWGVDLLGRDNHARACLLSSKIKELKARPWLDVDRMQGNIKETMIQGIIESSSAMVLVTELYQNKVCGKGNAGEHDNCRFEFEYLARTKVASKIIPVVMEPSCLDSRGWIGMVGATLGGQLYVDFTDDSKLEQAAMDIVSKLRTMVSATVEERFANLETRAPQLNIIEQQVAGQSASTPAAAIATGSPVNLVTVTASRASPLNVDDNDDDQALKQELVTWLVHEIKTSKRIAGKYADLLMDSGITNIGKLRLRLQRSPNWLEQLVEIDVEDAAMIAERLTGTGPSITPSPVALPPPPPPPPPLPTLKEINAMDIDQLVSTLYAHQANPTVCKQIAWAVSYFSAHRLTQEKAGSAGACEALVKTLSNHLPDGSVCGAVCYAMRNVSYLNGCNQRKLAGAGACELLVSLLRSPLCVSASVDKTTTSLTAGEPMSVPSRADTAEFCADVCATVSTLAQSNKDTQGQLNTAGAVEALVMVLESYNSNAIVCTKACEAVGSIALATSSICGNQEERLDAASPSCCQQAAASKALRLSVALVSTLRTHSAITSVCDCVCTAIYNLISCPSLMASSPPSIASSEPSSSSSLPTATDIAMVESFLLAGAPDVLLETLEWHTSVASSSERVCAAIYAILAGASSSAVSSAFTGTKSWSGCGPWWLRAKDAFLEVLCTHSLDTKICRWVCGVICVVTETAAADHHGGSSRTETEEASELCCALVQALSDHRANTETLMWVSRAMASLGLQT